MRYEQLRVWRRSHELAVDVYRHTASFPESERYGLVSQVRRAAYSVPTNIVEGHTRRSRKEFLHFLDIAKGSVTEVDYLVYLARDLGYLSNDISQQLRARCDEVRGLLHGLMASLENGTIEEETADYSLVPHDASTSDIDDQPTACLEGPVDCGRRAVGGGHLPVDSEVSEQ